MHEDRSLQHSAFGQPFPVVRIRCMESSRRRLITQSDRTPAVPGVGQLSLVEHALCPLAARQGTAIGQIHESHYRYTDAAGERRTARVRVICPLGLTPNDEFFLWGLLALTLSQPEPIAEFHVTPHYCLRQLGLIDQHGRRGGRQYQQFAQSLERLAAVSYQNDGFYDPLRLEHRRVGFGFLSYSLPLAADSSRAWRIVWNGVFFELAAAVGGHLRFDLEVYRRLDAASRRLFLFLCKLFRRKSLTYPIELGFLGRQVLGFAPTLAKRDLKIKVVRCIERLAEHEIVDALDASQTIRRNKHGTQTVQLARGDYFHHRRQVIRKKQLAKVDSPLIELMQAIGLDQRSITRCLSLYSTELVQQWADITLAARERHGASFFRKSPAAYFINNLQHAAKGQRTPPDWWHDLHRDESRRQAEICRKERSRKPAVESGDQFAALTESLARQFRAAGQSSETADVNARRFVESCPTSSETFDLATLLRILS